MISDNRYLISILLIVAIICILIALMGCVGERITGDKPISQDQQREDIVKQGQEFCKRWPDDIACPSQGKR